MRKMNALSDSPGLSPIVKISAMAALEDRTKGCAYGHDSVHVIMLQRIGKMYSSTGQFFNAVSYYQKAIDLISAKAGKLSISPRHLVISYYWVSAFYDSLHRPVEKIRALDSCLSIAIRSKYVDVYCLWALYKRAEYSFDLGDYHRCIYYAGLCESFAKEYVRNGSKAERIRGGEYVMTSLIWRVNAMMVLKDYASADTLLKIKAAECKEKGEKKNLGVILGLLAEKEVYIGTAEKALLYHNEAFAIEKSSGIAINCKAMLNGVGYDIYLKHFGNVAKALEYYRKALNYAVNDEDFQVLNSLESLSILNRIGNIFMIRGQYDSAFRYMQLAFDQVQPGINETGILNVSLDEFIRQRRISYISSLIVDKAEVFHQQYTATGNRTAIIEAIRVYKVADQFLERIKNEQSDARSKLFWRNDRRRLYERAIEACYADHNLRDAFYFFERSRAVLLYDELNRQRWAKEEDIVRQTQLKKRVNQLELELSNSSKSSARPLGLQEELINSRQELDRLDKQIKTRNPLYYQSYLETANITVEDVQRKLLKENDKFVEFFDGDSMVYSMIITPAGVFFDRTEKSKFDSLVTRFIALISNHNELNRNFDSFINTSKLLYELIFRDQPMPPGRIIISPDSRYFPLEALAAGNKNSFTYLIETHAVSYAHSAKYLMIDFESKQNNSSDEFLGMAPVYFRNELSQAPLLGSDKSLEQMQSLFQGSRLKMFDEASRNNFLLEFSKYEIIQLYTHASDGASVGDPRIYFADSALLLSELVNERKPLTRLIVLSACETGKGQWYRGEGVFSFNRGFAALGIPSSVTNLWSVDNQSTYKLTELFYKYLAMGLATDVALQRAKLEFIGEKSKEHRLPYYWASTILAGKVEIIQLARPGHPSNWIPAVAFSLLTLSGVLFWLINKKRRMREIRVHSE